MPIPQLRAFWLKSVDLERGINLTDFRLVPPLLVSHQYYQSQRKTQHFGLILLRKILWERKSSSMGIPVTVAATL